MTANVATPRPSQNRMERAVEVGSISGFLSLGSADDAQRVPVLTSDIRVADWIHGPAS